MQREKKCSRRAGFTLVEVIVVLVILAILAAIMIPAMTGWIDKAREKSAIVGCRACVLAAQTIATEQYATGTVNVTPSAVLELAEVKGSVGGIEIDDKATVEHLTYTTPQGLAVTYCRTVTDHPQVYNFLGGVMSGSASDIIKKALEGISNYNRVDSTAVDFAIDNQGKEIPDGTSFKAQMLAYMESLGYDMAASLLASGDVKTWMVDKEGGTKPILWWSDVDVSTATPGESIRVIRYNENMGTYTAGYMKVETNTVIDKDGNTISYNRLVGGVNGANWTEAPGQDKTTKGSYEDTMKIFDNLSETE